MRIRSVRRNDFAKIKEISSEFRKYSDPLFEITDYSLFTGFSNFVQNCKYYKVMEIEEQAVAWFAATDNHDQHHSATKAMTQIYYHCSLKGKKAIKALIDFHEHFVCWAERNGYEVCISGSYLPSKDVFNRILQKEG